MTRRFTSDYLSGTSYYNLASSGTVDNPDQRISSDVRCPSHLPATSAQHP